MKRRTLLKSVACSTVIGFAGCLNQGNDAGGGDGTNSSNNDNGSEKDNNNKINNSDNETTDSNSGNGNSTPRSSEGKSALVNHSFEIVSKGCGVKKRTVDTKFADHTVRITGTIRGKNSCYTAELKNVTFEQGTLTVAVRSFETESNGMCAMCLTNIEYESTYTFEGRLPKRVVVIHNGKHVLDTMR